MKAKLLVLAVVLGMAAEGAALAQRRPSGSGNSRTDRGRDSSDSGRPSESSDDINLAIGETKTISARSVKNFSEGVPGLVDIKLTSDKANFVIHGRRAGATSLLLIFEDGTEKKITINVWNRSPSVVERELSQLLEGIDGVRVRRVGASIVIDGQVSNEGELKRVQQVASLYQGQVTSIVTTASGSIVSATDDQKFLIRVDLYWVQFDKNASYAVGLGWPRGIPGPQVSMNFNLLTNAPTTATATLSDFALPRLDMAARHGWAKVMKQSTVITNNGVEAMFQNGGEQNFRVTTGLATGIQPVTYGADMKVLPRYRPDKNDIDMRINADLSELAAPGEGGIPGRTTAKLTTTVTLKLGQALILSGVRNRSTSHGVNDGLPILSDIPILGILFASHQNTDFETQGSIFLVPSVVATVPVPAADLVDSAISGFRRYDGDFRDTGGLAPDGAAAAAAETKRAK